MRGLYIPQPAPTRDGYDEVAHEAWLSWCSQVSESAKELAQLANKAWHKYGPAQGSYVTMMLGPFAALEELRQQLNKRASS